MKTAVPHLVLALLLSPLFPGLLPSLPSQERTSLLVEIDCGGIPPALLGSRLARSGLDVLPSGPGRQGPLRIILAPGEEEILQTMGLDFRILRRGRPLKEILASRDAPPDSRYYTTSEMYTLLGNLQKSYPGLARRIDLTQYTGAPPTHEGRHIYALKISDHVSKDEDEPNLAILAEHHARELNTQVMAVETARRLLQGYASNAGIRSIVDSHEIWIVPIVNPDGCEYVWNKDNWWRKNRRRNPDGSYGVDPNRNYPFRWRKCGYSTRPSSNIYCGPSAGSEPCVRTIMKLSDKRHFQKVLDFHSYGREILYPYSPCTRSVPSQVRNLFLSVISTLRSAASYRWRNPSASGEEPEWQWYRRGTLAFLVEVMTSFQPSYTSALAEERTRVRPLVDRWFSLAPPMEGHVKDLAGRPLAAALKVSGVHFSYGETIRSGGPWGRYALWLAPGTYDVTFSAPGYLPLTVRATLVSGRTLKKDVVLLPVPAVLAKSGTGRLGTRAVFTMTAPYDKGLPYFIGAAFGTSPGQKVGTRTLPLNGDALFMASIMLPGVFRGNLGRVNAQGRAVMTFSIPNWPALAGLKFHFAGFTVDQAYPLGVKTISNAVSLTLVQ